MDKRVFFSAKNCYIYKKLDKIRKIYYTFDVVKIVLDFQRIKLYIEEVYAMDYFIFECDTNGLYGEILSICAKVYDESLQIEKQSFYGAYQIDSGRGSDDDVRTKIIPNLSKADNLYNSETELLNAFWSFWENNCDNCRCVSDVPIPDEASVFKKCVDIKSSRGDKIPSFVMDLASVLSANGIEPSVDRKSLTSIFVPDDTVKSRVILIAAVLQRYMRKYFIFDCETDGLYGQTLGICAMLYDESLSIPLHKFYGALNIPISAIKSDFVKTHVYPYLSSATEHFTDEKDLLNAFWEFWKNNSMNC